MAALSEAVINDDRVVLLEQTLETNKNVIVENQQLREEMKARDEDHSKVLQDVLKELRQLKEGQRGEQPVQRRQACTRQKIQVPLTCRVC